MTISAILKNKCEIKFPFIWKRKKKVHISDFGKGTPYLETESKHENVYYD